jgi:hypothetical protein
MSNRLEEKRIMIEFTYEELRGLQYSIQRSDAMDKLCETNLANTPICHGLISSKFKIEKAVKELVEIDKQ